jgi:AIPR protein
MITIHLPVASVTKFENNGSTYFHAIACAEAFPKGIPLEANLRHPNKGGSVYASIVKTLIEEPERFLDGNLGIRITATDCQIKKKGVTEVLEISIGDSLGIANGGHSYFALFTALMNGADLSKAYLPVMIQKGLSKEDLSVICTRLNSSNTVDKRSIDYKNGRYDTLRSKLERDGYHRVAYYQNQPTSLSTPSLIISRDKRCSIVHIVEMLRCLDTTVWSSSKQPVTMISGGFPTGSNAIARAGELFDACFETAFWVEKQICLQFAKDSEDVPFTQIAGVRKLKAGYKIQSCSHFIDGSIIELKINSVMAYPIISAFRAFMGDSDWDFPPSEFRLDLLSHLYPTYKAYLKKGCKEGESIRSLLGSTEIWTTLYTKALEQKNEYLTRKFRKAS